MIELMNCNWDATCVDTLAPCHLPSTMGCAGAAAASAETLKSFFLSNFLLRPLFVELLRLYIS